MKRMIILILLLGGAGAVFYGWRSGGTQGNGTSDSAVSSQFVNPGTQTDSAQAGKLAQGVVRGGDEVALEGLGVQIGLGARQVQLQSGGGVFDRVHIGEKEKVRLTVNLGKTLAGKPILISAPNGGTLKRVGGGGLETLATGNDESLELEFWPTLGRGAYTVRVQHGGESQIIDLWAGDLPTLGEPGPKYVAGEFSEEVP